VGCCLAKRSEGDVRVCSRVSSVQAFSPASSASTANFAETSAPPRPPVASRP
jgi:hypothetical protein